MTDTFEPADGVKARWRYCYDLAVELKPGDEITYQHVTEMLDCDRTVAQAAMREAVRHLERDGHRSLRNVKQFGWIVIDSRGNLDETERRIRKSGRAVERAVRVLRATRRDELSQIERARMDFQQRQLVGAASLYQRRPKTFIELQQESKAVAELPFRKGAG